MFIITRGWGGWGILTNSWADMVIEALQQEEPGAPIVIFRPLLTYGEAKLSIIEQTMNDLLMSIPVLATKKELSHVIEVSWAPLETMTTTVSNLEDRVRILLRNSSN